MSNPGGAEDTGYYQAFELDHQAVPNQTPYYALHQATLLFEQDEGDNPSGSIEPYEGLPTRNYRRTGELLGQLLDPHNLQHAHLRDTTATANLSPSWNPRPQNLSEERVNSSPGELNQTLSGNFESSRQGRELERHNGARQKSSERDYSFCPKCNKRVKHERKHDQQVHGNRPYTCSNPQCSRTFNGRRERDRHQLIHAGVKKYSCEILNCSYETERKDNFRRHQRTHGKRE
ncbi:hypothetical protein BT63DRAFT_2536 [Microthyrium microscopicum]|uniref:C2H2 type master regulator of conidiophore development brlA n=1 Tax=Microthyrium microscopicum TaxID=703497 RepID=A0A6A6URL8_9PEZI|nr:hypothetical protein BT63DRAFT_2536 [Microthyrium microscopicum]